MKHSARNTVASLLIASVASIGVVAPAYARDVHHVNQGFTQAQQRNHAGHPGRHHGNFDNRHHGNHHGQHGQHHGHHHRSHGNNYSEAIFKGIVAGAIVGAIIDTAD